MTRREKVLSRIMSGTADQTIRFEELCALLRRFGFGERQPGGSHHIFFREGVAEIVNLQPRSGGAAKPYQVRQVRDIILKYRLADETEKENSDEA